MAWELQHVGWTARIAVLLIFIAPGLEAQSPKSQAAKSPIVAVPGPPKSTPTNPVSQLKMSTNSNPSMHAHTNRLSREKSPYLLQHQHNPVDWYAWGEEAFARARAEHKPIFLSIGYSTCHWCHVMERESFENDKVAEFLNTHFISIKVDREERPDVDKIYMNFVQSTSGQGGWPLNCFLTPELKPFFGGTYFPPESKYGRPSFLDLLSQIHTVWSGRNSELRDSADQLHARLEQMSAHEPTNEAGLGPDSLARAARLFKGSYDPKNGGFGDAPKFPQPSQPIFLLSQAVRSNDTSGIEMVLHTCDRMAAGGINDQLGGGFARYATDAHWLVPHFEKMLYDNAQLANLYLDAFIVSGEPRHAETVREIIRYVLRDMTHPDGGFYSAEDADSEGKEGKFYCWTQAELEGLLTPAEAKVVKRYFGITPGGNFVDHSDPHPLPAQNVLSVVDPKLSADEKELLHAATAKMFTTRSRRVRPHLDDKVLASWNGLMLGAMSRAYAILGDESFRAAAEKNLAFLQSRLWDATTKTLYHRWRDGERDSVQLQEAYAYLLAGVIDLYEATLEPRHLEFALALADSMLKRFLDSKDGGFWQSGDSPDLIIKVKEDYDGAQPSGNSVAALALLKLAAITERAEYREAAEGTLRLFANRLKNQPQALPYLLQALDFSLENPRRVVIAGDSKSPETRALLRAAHGVYQPRKVVLGTSGPVESFARTLPAKDGPTAYLCSGNSCLPPTREPAELKKLLK